MSSPTLTFTPAMFHASLTGIKNTTRRLITADCFRSQDGRLKFLGDEGTTQSAAHQPGQIKPMVTTWAVKSMFDDDKPTDLISSNDNPLIIWFNDGSLKPLWAGKNRPGRFLPAHLYALAPKVEILTVIIEFLHDITEDGAKREGITEQSKDAGFTLKYGLADTDGLPGTDDFGWPWQEWKKTAREAYFKLWDTINAEKDGGKYASQHNPACWVITYRLLPAA